MGTTVCWTMTWRGWARGNGVDIEHQVFCWVGVKRVTSNLPGEGEGLQAECAGSLQALCSTTNAEYF